VAKRFGAKDWTINTLSIPNPVKYSGGGLTIRNKALTNVCVRKKKEGERERECVCVSVDVRVRDSE
jgi:hypothetical protein